jgi:hypothetical protein
LSSPKTRTKLVWKIISLIALVLGLVASIIAIWTFLKVDRLEDVARRAKDWRIAVNLSEPKNTSEIFSIAVMAVGKCDLRITAAQVESNPAMNLVLAENRVELVLFVRQVSKAQPWSVQSKPLVGRDGAFDGLIFLGDKGYDYQIVVLAVPSGSVKDKQLTELPFSFAASNSVVVKRVQ